MNNKLSKEEFLRQSEFFPNSKEINLDFMYDVYDVAYDGIVELLEVQNLSNTHIDSLEVLSYILGEYVYSTSHLKNEDKERFFKDENVIQSMASVAADKYLSSWAYWMYKAFHDHTTTAAENQEGIFNPDGTLQSFKEKALSRTYIQYYQGEPLEVFFNDETSEFLARFKYDGSIEEPSVLYLNKELNYNNGYKLEITDDKGNIIEEVELEEKGNYIYFKVNRDKDENLVVKITLTPF